MPELSPDTILHVVTSLLLLAAGIGAWRGRRETTEVNVARKLEDVEKQHDRDVQRIDNELHNLRKRHHDLADAVQVDKVEIAVLKAKVNEL